MSLLTTAPKEEVRSRDVNQLIYLLSGKPGIHSQATRFTGFGDAGTYAVYVQNTTAPGFGLIVLKSDGSDTLFRSYDTGTDIKNFHLITQSDMPTPPTGLISFWGGNDNVLYYRTVDGVKRQLSYTPQSINYLVDPGFEIWDRGNGPFTTNGAWTAGRWQLGLGAGATTSIAPIASTDVGSVLAAQVTHGSAGSASSLNQPVENFAQFKSTSITFSARVKVNQANAIALVASDGTTTVSSSYHSGSDTWETLSITLAVGATPSVLSCSFYFNTTGSSYNGYLDSAVCTPGASAAGYTPLPLYDELQRCRRYRQVVEFNKSGRAYDSGATTTYIYDRQPLTPIMPLSPAPTLTKSLSVVNHAGTNQTFTEVSTAGSSLNDAYGKHSLDTVWSKASNLEDVILLGNVVVEVNP